MQKENRNKTFLVTGGAGFIGSHFAELCFREGHRVVILDSLTYAGNITNVPAGCTFRHGSICDMEVAAELFREYKPDAVFNFAAESHVCRSIAEGSTFVESNVRGTFVLLREALYYWRGVRAADKEFRYVQISTDEVFGDLGPTDPPFSASSPVRPHSPYSASKAAADGFVSSFAHTYGLPCIITRCSNNYGPKQHPEKLIPAAITAFLAGKSFVLHGDGSNVRDWLSVADHCRGILDAYLRGTPGESYCFGGSCERTNKQIVSRIAEIMHGGSIEYGPDRPGNDRRYAIDFSKAKRELGWEPGIWSDFESALAHTVLWYSNNQDWIKRMQAKA